MAGRKRTGIFRRRFCPVVCVLLLPVFILSCIGTSSQIKLNPDGTGSFTIEYRISMELENLGKFDGNEKQPLVPVGKADLERTVARVPGLRLNSFSSRQDGINMVYRADFSFDSPEALAFFDSQGLRFKLDLPAKKMILRFSEIQDFDFSEMQKIDPEFKEVVAGALQGYDFSLSFTVPGSAKTKWFDGNGNTLGRFPGICSAEGMKVMYTVPMAELVLLDAPVSLEISW